MNPQICTYCRRLSRTSVCDYCEAKTRAVEENDAVFFAELSSQQQEMLVEVFRQNAVEYFSQPIFGNSQTNKPHCYNVFVPYRQYSLACDCYNLLWDKVQQSKPVGVLGTTVQVVVDRPLGSVHPNHPDLVCQLNYGFVPGVLGGDGEEQDAYVLGVDCAVESFCGEVVAVIVRQNDVETKWVVAPVGSNYTKQQIAKAVRFQEKYFQIEVVTKNDFPPQN